MMFLDDFEELDQFNAISFKENNSQLGVPLYNTSVHREFCRLSIIMDRILGSLYAVKNTTKSQEELFRRSRSLQFDIEEWYKTLPQHLVVGNLGPNSPAPLPHILALLYDTLCYSASIQLLIPLGF